MVEASQVPLEIKYIVPFIQRSAELKQREPIVAYYALYYAVKMAVDKGCSNQESKAFLLSMMDELEQDKKNLEQHEEITNEVVGYDHCLNFATRIFMNADAEDRQGKASKITAKTFFAAALFFELLKVFKDLEPTILNKIKYSKFKAADILKAIKEGRTPRPGSPIEMKDDTEMNEQIESTNEPNSIQQNESTAIQENTAPIQQNEPSVESPNSATPKQFFTPSAPNQHQIDSNEIQSIQATETSLSHLDPFALDHKALSTAQKHARYAISAIQYEDIPTALDNLRKAIALIEPFMN